MRDSNFDDASARDPCLARLVGLPTGSLRYSPQMTKGQLDHDPTLLGAEERAHLMIASLSSDALMHYEPAPTLALGGPINFRRVLPLFLLGTLILMSAGCDSGSRLPQSSSKEYNNVVSAFYVGLAALQVG